MTSARPDSRLGTDLGPYRIERVLGRGGMGVVYLAEQRELGRKVALKLLPDELASDADFRARFDRESKLAASIDHPNIIPLYEAGEIDGTSFLAMRYVDGSDLATGLADGPMEPDEVVAILAQVAGALDAAHERGLVHRDVKPGNVLLDRTAHVYLTDFGLTKETGTESGLTRVGSFMGTPAYMAPEQIEGQAVDGRADQYSLACMTFELLTGSVPFKRDQEFAVAMAHVRDMPPAPTSVRPDLPAAVDLVVGQAMAKDREARYPSCSAFIEDLRRALGGGAISARPMPTADRDRRPLVLAAVVGLALLAVAGLAWASGGLGGAGSGGPSPSGSVLVAEASPTEAPTPTSSPAPTSTTFPTEQEAAFIAALPNTLTDCQRTTEKAAAGPAGLDRRVSLSREGGIQFHYNFDVAGARMLRLACSVDAENGVDAAYVFWNGALGGGATTTTTGYGTGMAGEWPPDTLIGWMAGLYALPDGDCGVDIPAYGRWSSGREDRGRIGCRLSESTGKAWIYWTDEKTSVYGWASAPDGDRAALYDWWKQTAPFIVPPEGL